MSFVPCFVALLSAGFSGRVKPAEQGWQSAKNDASCDTLLVKSGGFGDHSHTEWGLKVSCCPLVAKE